MKKLKYYCFDIDDNLVHMPTKIYLINNKTGKEIGVSSEEFAKIRSDKENWSLTDNSFNDFTDDGPRGKNAFIEDFITSVSLGNFAPSWHKFIQCLVEGSIFALITARGHKSQTLREGIEYVIDFYLKKEQKELMYNNLLYYLYIFDGETERYSRIPKMMASDFSKNPLVIEYLDNCGFYGVSNEKFKKKYNLADASSPEKGKEIALKDFIKKVNAFSEKLDIPMSIGMSDDDIKNLLHIEKVFLELQKIYPETLFFLYNTSEKTYKKKKINVLNENKDESFFITSFLNFIKNKLN